MWRYLLSIVVGLVADQIGNVGIGQCPGLGDSVCAHWPAISTGLLALAVLLGSTKALAALRARLGVKTGTVAQAMKEDNCPTPLAEDPPQVIQPDPAPDAEPDLDDLRGTKNGGA